MSNFIEQQYQNREEHVDNANSNRPKNTVVAILCSRIVKGTIIIVIIALVFPILAYYFAISRSVTDPDDTQDYSCLIQEEFRVACGPPDLSETDCYKIMCCYNATTGQCHHYIPSKYFYETSDNILYTTSIETSPLGSPMISNIQFDAIETDTTLSMIIKQHSVQQTQRQKQRSTELKSTLKELKNNFQIVYSTNKLIFLVQDTDNNTIFNTANGAVIITNDYWEWTFQLSNDTIFGLDRNVISLNNNETLTKIIYKNVIDHTTQPVFWAYINNKFYTCQIKNSGPLELTILASHIITLRSFTDQQLEIQLTLGPTPAEIYQKQIINTYVPPIWALGTHNCRKGNDTNLNSLLSIYSTNNKSTFDTDCIHENLFFSLQKSNTENDLNNFKLILENFQNSTKFILSLPPHILANESNTLYRTAISLNILYNSTTGEVYQGQYLDEPVVYPDFSHPAIKNFTEYLFEWLETNIGITYISGFVLNDNWPQDDSYQLDVDNERFRNFSEALKMQINHTLPWNLTASNGNLHFIEHNSYGEIQSTLLIEYLNQTGQLDNFFIASASTILEENDPVIYDNFESSWDNFKLYLDKMLFNSITGNSMVGFPICGDTALFDKTLQEILCIRWYLAASTMPYFRVSSGNPFRDPANFNTLYGTNIVNQAMERRKYFIDYFYTILRQNEPLLRPMYYNYFSDNTTFNFDNQYTIGEHILVAHPLSSGRTKLAVYLPPVRGNWYEFWSGNMYTPLKDDNYTVRIDLLPTDWISFIAQGHIVTLTNSTELNFYIALTCSAGGCNATGEIYKDNTLITLSANASCIVIENLPTNCDYTIGYVKRYGYDGAVSYADIYASDYNLCEENNNENVTYCFNNATENADVTDIV